MNRYQSPEYKEINDVNIPNVEEINILDKYPLYYIPIEGIEISKIVFVFDAGYWQQNKSFVSLLTKSILAEGANKFYSAKEIAEILDFHGAYFSTNSRSHSSSMQLTCLNKYLPKLLNIFSKILKSAIFTQEEFILKQNYHKQRYTINIEKGSTIANILMQSALYGETHPYGKHSQPDAFDEVNLNDIKNFFFNNYIGKNLKIIVVSNKKNLIIEELSNNLRDLTYQSSVQGRDIIIPSLPQPHRIEEERKQLLQSSIRLGWHLFDATHEDSIDMSILNFLLGGYFGSRLSQNIRQDKGYTYSIYSSIYLQKYGGSLQIKSKVKKNKKEKAISEIKKEILKLQENKISNEELQSMRNFAFGAILRSMNNKFSYSNKISNFIIYGIDFNYYCEFQKKISNITAEKIQELAHKYLNLNDMYTVIVG